MKVNVQTEHVIISQETGEVMDPNTDLNLIYQIKTQKSQNKLCLKCV